MWNNIDFDNNCIHIEQQMQYQEGLITLSPLKTRNAKRTLYMNSKLKNHLLSVKAEIDAANINIPNGQDDVLLGVFLDWEKWKNENRPTTLFLRIFTCWQIVF